MREDALGSEDLSPDLEARRVARSNIMSAGFEKGFLLGSLVLLP